MAAAAHASQAGRHVFHPIACLCGLAACQKMAMGRLHCVLHYTPYECFHQSVNQQCWLHWKCCVIAARRTHAVVYRSSSLQPVPGPGWSLHTASIIAVRLTMSLQCLCSAPPPRADYAPTTAADAPEPAAAAAPSVPAGPVSAEPMGPVAAAPPVRPCCHFLRLQLQAAGVQSLAGRTISRRSAGGCALYTRPPLNSNETAQVHMQGAPPGMEAMLQNPDMMRNMSSMMANLTPEDMQRMSSMAGAFGGGGGAPGARRSKSQWLTSGNRAGTMLWLRRSGARPPHKADCTELDMASDGVRGQARAGCQRCRRT